MHLIGVNEICWLRFLFTELPLAIKTGNQSVRFLPGLTAAITKEQKKIKIKTKLCSCWVSRQQQVADVLSVPALQIILVIAKLFRSTKVIPQIFTLLSSFTSRAQFDPLVNFKSHRGRRFPLLWRFVQNPQNTHCKLRSVFFFLSRRSETTAVSAPFYTSGQSPNTRFV